MGLLMVRRQLRAVEGARRGTSYPGGGAADEGQLTRTTMTTKKENPGEGRWVSDYAGCYRARRRYWHERSLEDTGIYLPYYLYDPSTEQSEEKGIPTNTH